MDDYKTSTPIKFYSNSNFESNLSGVDIGFFFGIERLQH